MTAGTEGLILQLLCLLLLVPVGMWTRTHWRTIGAQSTAHPALLLLLLAAAMFALMITAGFVVPLAVGLLASAVVIALLLGAPLMSGRWMGVAIGYPLLAAAIAGFVLAGVGVGEISVDRWRGWDVELDGFTGIALAVSTMVVLAAVFLVLARRATSAASPTTGRIVVIAPWALLPVVMVVGAALGLLPYLSFVAHTGGALEPDVGVFGPVLRVVVALSVLPTLLVHGPRLWSQRSQLPWLMFQALITLPLVVTAVLLGAFVPFAAAALVALAVMLLTVPPLSGPAALFAASLRYPLLAAVLASVALAAAGPGPLSVDRALDWSPLLDAYMGLGIAAVVGVIILAALAVLATRIGDAVPGAPQSLIATALRSALAPSLFLLGVVGSIPFVAGGVETDVASTVEASGAGDAAVDGEAPQGGRPPAAPLAFSFGPESGPIVFDPVGVALEMLVADFAPAPARTDGVAPVLVGGEVSVDPNGDLNVTAELAGGGASLANVERLTLQLADVSADAQPVARFVIDPEGGASSTIFDPAGGVLFDPDSPVMVQQRPDGLGVMIKAGTTPLPESFDVDSFFDIDYEITFGVDSRQESEDQDLLVRQRLRAPMVPAGSIFTEGGGPLTAEDQLKSTIWRTLTGEELDDDCLAGMSFEDFLFALGQGDLDEIILECQLRHALADNGIDESASAAIAEYATGDTDPDCFIDALVAGMMVVGPDALGWPQAMRNPDVSTWPPGAVDVYVAALELCVPLEPFYRAEYGKYQYTRGPDCVGDMVTATLEVYSWRVFLDRGILDPIKRAELQKHLDEFALAAYTLLECLRAS